MNTDRELTMTKDTHALLHLPATAAWRHRGLRDGFEIAHFATDASNGTTRIWGNSIAVEGAAGYAVTYSVSVDESWRTLAASIETRTRDATWRTDLARAEDGTWWVDGQVRPDLAECTDIDLEASVVTNTIPIHRLSPAPGVHEVSAVYIPRHRAARRSARPDVFTSGARPECLLVLLHCPAIRVRS